LEDYIPEFSLVRTTQQLDGALKYLNRVFAILNEEHSIFVILNRPLLLLHIRKCYII
jgi:hypothetical protein